MSGTNVLFLITSSLCYVSFMDDSSHKTQIYFLKTKDEVFSKFMEFKALVENQIGKKIKVLRSNNGGEYTSKEFDACCRDARDQEGSNSALQHSKMGLQRGRIGPLLRLQKP
jgi:hypothetical protein